MHRTIIIKFLMLTSIVSAVPDDRGKRDLSSIKNFFTSIFYDEKTQKPDITNIEPDHEYEFYKIPGYDDVMIKTRPIKGVVQKSIIDKPGQALKIEPFECFLGTKNSKETLKAFRNVNNLLSTEVFDEKENNLIKVTMVPMMVDAIKSLADDVARSMPHKSVINPAHNELKNKSTENNQLENKEVSNLFTKNNSAQETQTNSIQLKSQNIKENEVVSSNKGTNESIKNIDENNAIISNGSKFYNMESYSSTEKIKRRVINHLFDLETDSEYSLEPDLNENEGKKNLSKDKILQTSTLSLLHNSSSAENTTNALEIVDINENLSNMVTFTDNPHIQDKVIQYVNERRIQNKSQENEIAEEGHKSHVNNNLTTEIEPDYGSNDDDNSTTSKETEDEADNDRLSTGRGDIPEGLNY